MITNNNTNDVAYLGTRHTKHNMKEYAYSINSSHIRKYPRYWWDFIINDILLFDCNGCRYGFRIKQLKK